MPKMNKKYWRRSWPGKPIRSKHWANPLDYRTRRRFTNIIAVPQDDHRAGGRDLLDAKYPVSLFAKLLSGLHRSLRSLIVTILQVLPMEGFFLVRLLVIPVRQAH